MRASLAGAVAPQPLHNAAGSTGDLAAEVSLTGGLGRHCCAVRGALSACYHFIRAGLSYLAVTQMRGVIAWGTQSIYEVILHARITGTE